uniref:Uncharacterized protein n=1 Tax=Oryza punctata TaxID=4537 RepID=A0A0E0JRM1_ORYPU
MDITLFTKQGSTMDRNVGVGLVVPPAALQFAVSVTILTLLPVYDRALVPIARHLTRHPAGITTLQRVGAGMAMSGLAMVVAALVEAKRLRVASDAGLISRPDATVPMSVWWLVPQFVLLGIAKVFGLIGLEEFFYDQVPDELRSVGLAMSLSVLGVGSYASGVLVSAIDWGRRGESWFSDNLNRARLNYTSTGSSPRSLHWRSSFSPMESGRLLAHSDEPSTASKPAGRGGWRAALFIIERVVQCQAQSFGMLVVSSTLEPTHLPPASCNGGATACSPPLSPTPRHAFFYAALYLLALAQGFHQPCSEAFGADQFAAASDDANPAANTSRSSYFNWFHFSISCGYAVAITLLSYVEDNVGWTAGFAACLATMVVYLAVFLLGTGTYRVERPVDGAPLARLAETSAAAARAWTRRVFSRKDAICSERLLSKEEVDAKGYLVNLLPVWLISIVFAIIAAQDVTLFTKQGSTMDRHVGGLVVPPAALQFAMSVTILIMLPVYDRTLVPLVRLFTGHPAGVTTLQRVGAGMAMSCLAMAVAALVEAKRLRAASDAGLIDRPDATVPMGVWWLVPQYVLLGISKVLSIIGLEEFFYG